jgi:hypothetical protein
MSTRGVRPEVSVLNTFVEFMIVPFLRGVTDPASAPSAVAASATSLSDWQRLTLRSPRHPELGSVVAVAQLWSETVALPDSLPTPQLRLVCTR